MVMSEAPEQSPGLACLEGSVSSCQHGMHGLAEAIQGRNQGDARDWGNDVVPDADRATVTRRWYRPWLACFAALREHARGHCGVTAGRIGRLGRAGFMRLPLASQSGHWYLPPTEKRGCRVRFLVQLGSWRSGIFHEMPERGDVLCSSKAWLVGRMFAHPNNWQECDLGTTGLRSSITSDVSPKGARNCPLAESKRQEQCRVAGSGFWTFSESQASCAVGLKLSRVERPFHESAFFPHRPQTESVESWVVDPNGDKRESAPRGRIFFGRSNPERSMRACI
jgi:hypothetical protein